MSEPKFTPGPLSANKEMPGLWGVRDEWGNATVFTNSGHYGDETRKANAILYAAAPEMYEMLKRLSTDTELSEYKREDIKELLKHARGEQ